MPPRLPWRARPHTHSPGWAQTACRACERRWYAGEQRVQQPTRSLQAPIRHRHCRRRCRCRLPPPPLSAAAPPRCRRCPHPCSCAAAGVWGASKVVPKLWQPGSPPEQLLAAAKRGSMADVTRALAAGAAVDSRDPATRETALIAAAGGPLAGHMDVLQGLLAAGARPEYADAAGNAALHIAAGCGNEGHALALLEAGAPADQPNLEGLTPIEVAFQQGNTAIVLALLSFGADPAPLQKIARASSWAAFRRAHAAALRQAELAFQQRLEQQWQESAASSSGSSSASADWPAGPQEQPGALGWFSGTPAQPPRRRCPPQLAKLRGRAPHACCA